METRRAFAGCVAHDGRPVVDFGPPPGTGLG